MTTANNPQNFENLRWYYADQHNQPVGPISFDDLKKLWASGIVKPNTCVVEEGGSDWRSFDTLFPAQPPKLPPIPIVNPSLPPQPQKSAKRQSALWAVWFCIVILLPACSPISALIALMDKRINKTAKYVVCGISLVFFFPMLIAMVGGFKGGFESRSQSTSHTPAPQPAPETSNRPTNPKPVTIAQPTRKSFSTSSAPTPTPAPAIKILPEQQTTAYRDKVENMMARLDSILEDAGSDLFLRNIASWNREASDIRDAVFDFANNSNSTDSYLYSLKNAAMHMGMAGDSVAFRKTDDAEENIRLAKISLAQFQSYLITQKASETTNSEQSNKARQIYMMASKTSDLTLYKQSADMGYWQAQLTYANFLDDEKQCSEIIEYLEKAAEQGSLDAMNNLGHMYKGYKETLGMASNSIESLKWYRIGEIVCLEPSPNVSDVKKKFSMMPAEIEAAEGAAKKWVAEHPGIKRAVD